jgi:hypothetical protein
MTLYKEHHKETNKNKQNVLNKAKLKKDSTKTPNNIIFYDTPSREPHKQKQTKCSQ